LSRNQCSLKSLRHYCLGDEDAIKAAMRAVANNGKAKRM